MKLISLIMLACMAAGCATATITVNRVDGKVSECTGTYFSLFKDISDINMSVCGAKGGAGGSSVNTALAGELFRGLLAAP